MSDFDMCIVSVYRRTECSCGNKNFHIDSECLPLHWIFILDYIVNTQHPAAFHTGRKGGGLWEERYASAY